MKLELKHLAPYLPYGLKGCEYVGTTMNPTIIYELTTIHAEYNYPFIWTSGTLRSRVDCKPIMRSLSDLSKSINNNGYIFTPYVELLRVCNFDVDNMTIDELNYYKPNSSEEGAILLRMYPELSKLFEWHFDVFGLIEKGLAIDINTLK